MRSSRARRVISGAGRWLGSIEIAPRLADELLAFAIFTLAVVIALPLVGLAGDSLLALLGDLNAQALGRMAIAVPLGLSVISVEIWREGEAGQRVRRLVGGVIAVAAAVGLLGLSNPDGAVEQVGGYAGRGIALGMTEVLGEVGAGLTCIAVGIVGVFLVTGYDTRAIADSWWRIRASRSSVVERTGDAIDQVDGPDPRKPRGRRASADSARSETEPFLPSRTAALPDEPAVEPEAVVAALPRQVPVIKVPKSDKAAREIRKAVTAVAEAQEEVDPRAGWKLPSLDMLALYESGAPDQSDLERKARRIEETLASFKVDATVREVFPGPAVTLFTLEPGVGVQVRRITALQNDLALALAAPSIRIEAPVPGMARVGIEIPNGSISTVGLRETLESTTFAKSAAKLPLPLGRDVNGRYIIGDLARMPHLLIAGATGSGKSVCINGIIATFLLSKTPDDLRMVMIDPKMVELAGYEGVPHLKTPVVTEMDKVVGALRAVLREMERRYQLFSRLGVRNIDGYELRRSTEPTLEKLPYLVLIIDELADLMMTTPDEVETILVRLCQMARATGIHVIIATQRPSVDVLTGLIKANVPARIAFAVASQTDSRVILDMPGAERLLGRGDMLFMPADAPKPHRVQGSFIDDQDLQKLVRHWRLQAPQMAYEPEWEQLTVSEDAHGSEEDPLWEQAVTIVRQQGTASASMLQRRLRVGYNRAARLIETMEDEGIIGPADGSRGRQVLLDDDWDGE
jgi:S-DNA-T family DNA segregation ATPase FtsK/SpoIIIE